MLKERILIGLRCHADWERRDKGLCAVCAYGRRNNPQSEEFHCGISGHEMERDALLLIDMLERENRILLDITRDLIRKGE